MMDMMQFDQWNIRSAIDQTDFCDRPWDWCSIYQNVQWTKLIIIHIIINIITILLIYFIAETGDMTT